MIINYTTGASPTQCQIVKDGRASSTCPNVAGTVGHAQRALSVNGVNSGTLVSLTWSYVKQEINASRPIYGRITWVSSGSGHAWVIRGYYDGAEGYAVSYINPASGVTTSTNWNTYVSNSAFTMNGSLIYLYRK